MYHFNSYNYLDFDILVQEWQKNLKQKLDPYMEDKEPISDEEVTKLGKKDPEAYPFNTYLLPSCYF